MKGWARAVAAALLFYGCGTESSGSKQYQSPAAPTPAPADGKASGKTAGPGAPDSGSADADADAGPSAGPTPAPGAGGSGAKPSAPQPAPGSQPGPSPAPAGGADYFKSAVVPVFQANCVTCHADPRQPVQIRAPLTIYSYDKMKALLAKGGSPQDNGLVSKVRNLDSHQGGDRCMAGAGETPCKEIAAWWVQEYGEPKGGGGATQLGKIAEVSSLGRVYGYAADPANPTTAVTVTFYVDGPKGTGTAAGSTVASKSGQTGPVAGDHTFSLDLADTFRNGKQHEIYAYATIGGSEQPLSTVGYKYTAYAFSAAGRNYYEANVKAKLSGCAGCHTVSYEQQFYSLISPSPVQGGTAANNQLLNKAAQVNGTTHGGGQRCTSATASPCSEFQTWWQTEFGAKP